MGMCSTCSGNWNKLGGSPTLGILDLVEPPWISLVVPTNAKDICRSGTTRGTSVRHGPAPACWLCILHPEGLREKTQRVNSRDPLVGYNLQDVCYKTGDLQASYTPQPSRRTSMLTTSSLTTLLGSKVQSS